MSTVEMPVREEITTANPDLDELNALWETPAHQKDEVWILLILDDTNTMDHVMEVFMDYFMFDKEKATRKMLEVHYNGKAIVADGTRGEMLVHNDAMKSYGLTSKVEQA